MTAPHPSAPQPLETQPAAVGAHRSPAETDWWRDAVVYQVYLQSFADGDGDGTGDLPGLVDRLPYLAALGVDAVWVTPWYPSPLHDGGYDVSDYRDIHLRYGRLADAERLVVEAHRLGLRVICDIVPNHTSREHRWFRQALESAPGSAARGRYHFRDGRGDGSTPPNDWLSVFGGPAWTRVPDPDGHPGQWYLHLFDSSQPDLDWACPEVRQEFDEILRFWFDRGVDGFRVDVATALVKAPGLPDLGYDEDAFLADLTRPDHPHRDRDEVHDIYRRWRRIADGYDPPRVFVAEAWVDDAERLGRYLRADELHTTFNLAFLKSAWDATGLRDAIEQSFASTLPVGAAPTWVLSNHDVERVVTRYGRADTRRRPGVWGDSLGPVDEELGRRRARAAMLLCLALPGSAYLYQGDELGLADADLAPEDRRDPVWFRSAGARRGRDGARVPLPWTRQGPSLGFGADGGWLPQPSGWGALSVEAQRDDPTSFLELTRAALTLRREHVVDAGSPVDWYPTGDPDLIAFRRGNRLLCVVNTGDHEIALPVAYPVLLASGPTPQGRVAPSCTVWLDTSKEHP